MVEINNQRKAFLDMLAWSEGTDNGRRKPEIAGYDIKRGRNCYPSYSDHPRKLVTLNPAQINRRRAFTSFFPVGGPTAATAKTLRKSGRCGIAAD